MLWKVSFPLRSASKERKKLKRSLKAQILHYLFSLPCTYTVPAAYVHTYIGYVFAKKDISCSYIRHHPRVEEDGLKMMLSGRTFNAHTYLCVWRNRYTHTHMNVPFGTIRSNSIRGEKTTTAIFICQVNLPIKVPTM